MNFYNLDEIKRRADCEDVARRLLALDVKNGRCIAKWRGGDDYTVALSKEGFYDHKTKQGGSVIDFVMLVNGCDINLAADTLGQFLGLEPIKFKTIESRKVAKEYIYTDEAGNPKHKTVRFEPKDFRQYRFEDNEWKIGLENIQTYPYNLPEILKHDTVLVHEGEKACECAIINGFPNSTTLPMGAGKWKNEWAQWFKNKNIIIVRDNDDAGYEHGARLAWELKKIVASIRFITPSMITKGDAYEYFTLEGGTPQKLKALIDNTLCIPLESITEPKSSVDSREEINAKEANRTSFCNYKITIDPSRGNIQIPRNINEMIKDLKVRLMGFPKVVAGQLFDQNKKTKKIEYIKDAKDLTSWIAERTKLNPIFKQGAGYITPEMLYSSLTRTCEQYELISRVPHFPAIDGAYYSHGKLPEPSADFRYFEKFINFFCPASYADALMMKTCVCSLFFYEPRVDKPMWIIDTTDGAGQGTGKTKFVEMLSILMDSEPFWVDSQSVGNDMLLERIIKRLLSPQGREKRIFLIDNVQGYFKSEALASFVTQGSFSGLAPYGRGETTRINDLNFFITSNGGSFDRDLIDRSFIIHLDKPKQPLQFWESEVYSFISSHRFQIIADIGGLLQRKPNYKTETHSRFRSWERKVLMSVINNIEDYKIIFDTIKDRRNSADGEKERGEILNDAISSKIADLGYDPNKDFVWLESPVIIKWAQEAIPGFGGSMGGYTIQIIKQMYRTNIFTRLSPHITAFPLSSSSQRRRGMMWNGDEYIRARQSGNKPNVIQLMLDGQNVKQRLN